MSVTMSHIRIARGSLSAFEAVPEGGVETLGTVVMVPGFTGSKEDFLPMAPYVTAAGYRLIAYSQLGQYDSEGPDGPGDEAAYTVALLAADLAEVLDLTAPGERVHLVGHSFAGLVTRAAVLRDPARFLDHVILDSPPSGESLGMDVAALATALRTQGNAGLWQAMFAPVEAALPAPVRQFLYDRMMTTKNHNLIGIAEAMSDEPDRVAELAATGVPILVAAGERDFIPLAAQEDAANRLGVPFEVIEGATHTPNEEKPEELTKLFVAFWNRHRP